MCRSVVVSLRDMKLVVPVYCRTMHEHTHTHNNNNNNKNYRKSLCFDASSHIFAFCNATLSQSKGSRLGYDLCVDR